MKKPPVRGTRVFIANNGVISLDGGAINARFKPYLAVIGSSEFTVRPLVCQKKWNGLMAMATYARMEKSSAARKPGMLRSLASLFIVAVIVLASAGCATTDANKIDTRTLTDLFIHFKKCGLHPQKQYPVVYQAVLASDGIVSVIDGTQVEIYVYDQTKRLPREKLERIKKNKVMKILANPVPAVVNGHFVMLTYSKTPALGKIIEAFKSFKQ
jgi:hypothetical protein